MAAGTALAAGIAASGDFLGSIFSGAFNSKEAQKNRDWQERMSNTAHQREVADLRSAKLNPILSATGGSGASSPVGGAATMTAPMIGSSALSGYKGSSEKKVLESQSNMFNSQSTKALAEAKTQETVQANNDASTSLINVQKMLTDKELSWFDRKALNHIETNIKTAMAAQGQASAAKLSAVASNTNANANAKNAETGRGQLKVNAYNAKTERFNAKGNQKYQGRRSGGYSRSVQLGPFSIHQTD